MFSLELFNKTYKLNFYPFFSDYYKNNAANVEPTTRDWFLNNIKETDVIFDIGAHIGLYTILFSTKTNFVYAFEPTQTYDDYLIPNLKINKIDKVHTEKLAFGNKFGELEEPIYRIWGTNPEIQKYNFTTIDKYCKINNIIPNIIKIDADGYDFEILQGAKDTLNENNVLVCVEVNYALKTRGFLESDVLNFMDNIGYELIMVLDTENHFFQKKI